MKFKVLIFIVVMSLSFVNVKAQGNHTSQIKKKPHVILIAVDTLRRDHLGCYGYKRNTTPNIDCLAKEGVLFKRSYSTASWTLPSFMSVFTGLMPSAHGIMYSGRLPNDIPMLAESFKEKGYYCAAVVSNPCVGNKYGFARGFDVYDDYSIFMGAELGVFNADYDTGVGSVNEVVSSALVTRQAELLIDKAKKNEKPAFLFLHYFDPHDSYIPPAPFDRKYDKEYDGKITGRNVPRMRRRPPAKRDLYNLRARYDGEINYTDSQVGILLDKIDKTFDPSNTLIIFFSDHGEAFGEHEILLHGNSVFREEICVPMIWRWKGVIPGNKKVDSLVLIMDIAKTLKKIIRLKKLNLLQGESLWPLLMNNNSQNKRAILSQKACRSNRRGFEFALTQGDFRFHAWFKKTPRDENTKFLLFNIKKDPFETKNIISEFPNIAKKMKQTLVQKWQESIDIHKYYYQKSKNPNSKMDKEHRKTLKTMGYLN